MKTVRHRQPWIPSLRAQRRRFLLSHPKGCVGGPLGGDAASGPESIPPPKPPFPALHIDPTCKFEPMYDMRDSGARKLGLQLLTPVNTERLRRGTRSFAHSSAIHTDLMKPQSLRRALDKYRIYPTLDGARLHDQKSSANELAFSLAAYVRCGPLSRALRRLHLSANLNRAIPVWLRKAGRAMLAKPQRLEVPWAPAAHEPAATTALRMRRRPLWNGFRRYPISGPPSGPSACRRRTFLPIPVTRVDTEFPSRQCAEDYPASSIALFPC